MKTEARISSIGRHRFEIDGTGVRTLIVFSGCPLRCKHCINPYTWDGSRKGVIYTPSTLVQKVSIDNLYFQATNGGVTFGGGEPLLYPDFISNFIDIAPSAWTYVVETSLAVPFENIEKVADKIGQFVVDIKSMDEDIYKAYTDGDLTLVRQNLISLIDLVGKERVAIRVPIIPDFADANSQKATIAELNALGIHNIDAFRYKIRKK